MSDYGGITVIQDDAGRQVIKQADDMIGVSIAALSFGAGYEYGTNASGHLVIFGQLTYRPVRFDHDGRVIVCERIT